MSCTTTVPRRAEPKTVYARPMSVFAGVTRPLQRLDGAVNGLSDLFVRAAPWMWWPASPPRPDRPFEAGQHAAYLMWSAVGFLVGEVLAHRMPQELRSTGRRLRNERIATVIMPAAVWFLVAGAWDRRAERFRRKPWQRVRR
jgi:hypothetical protein